MIFISEHLRSSEVYTLKRGAGKTFFAHERYT